MSACPVCATPIPADAFGLIDCEQCGSPLIVHVDGRVESSAAMVSEALEEPPDLGPVDLAPPPLEESPLVDELPYESPSENFGAQDQDAPGELFAEDAPLGPSASAVEEAPLQEPSAAEPLLEEPPFEEPALEEPATEVYRAPKTISDSADLSDVSDFGNSPQAGAREGTLRYRLRISGIDTVDIREAFRELITDKKFMWDVDEILKALRHGEVQLEDVTSVKAHILVSRLRSLPVNVEWEQYGLHQT
jgi:hypothetical protein